MGTWKSLLKDTGNGWKELKRESGSGWAALLYGIYISPTAIHSKCGEDASYPASNTIDGNTSTMWWHVVSEEHYIVWDMGATKTMTAIRLYCEPHEERALCKVNNCYIDNNAPPTTLIFSDWELEDVDTCGWHEKSFTQCSGRYVKITLNTYYSAGSPTCGNYYLGDTGSPCPFNEVELFVV